MLNTSLEDWDEKVAPGLSRVRQNAFWIKEKIRDIRHVIKLMKEFLPEWYTDAENQLDGTIRELEEALAWLKTEKEAMAARRTKGKSDDCKASHGNN